MRKALTLALVFLAMFAMWTFFVIRWFDSVTPGGETLAEHLAKMPVPDRQCVFTAAGQDYLAVFGPVQMLPRFPSGPPVYVFDKAGRLVGWTPDEGDDDGFHERWPGAFSGRTITPAQLALWPEAGR